MSVLRYPFHLLAIVAGATAVAVVLWRVESSGAHFATYTGGLFALLAAVDLARRLGLEPKDDPAALHNRKTR
ncbi:MAG: hypothetical protein K2X25_09905 [Caulobacteraceae bacterium]|nr:hypothetical protein [Caulobacteraceae bacterium]